MSFMNRPMQQSFPYLLFFGVDCVLIFKNRTNLNLSERYFLFQVMTFAGSQILFTYQSLMSESPHSFNPHSSLKPEQEGYGMDEKNHKPPSLTPHHTLDLSSSLSEKPVTENFRSCH